MKCNPEMGEASIQPVPAFIHTRNLQSALSIFNNCFQYYLEVYDDLAICFILANLAVT